MARVWILAGATALGCVLIYLTDRLHGRTDDEVRQRDHRRRCRRGLPAGRQLDRPRPVPAPWGGLRLVELPARAPWRSPTRTSACCSAPWCRSCSAPWPRPSPAQPETFLVMLLGAGSMGALYTTDFFLDPQSINFTLPIAISQVMIALALGYVLGVLAKTFSPAPKEAQAAPAAEASAPGRLGPLTPQATTLQPPAATPRRWPSEHDPAHDHPHVATRRARRRRRTRWPRWGCRSPRARPRSRVALRVPGCSAEPTTTSRRSRRTTRTSCPPESVDTYVGQSVQVRKNADGLPELRPGQLPLGGHPGERRVAEQPRRVRAAADGRRARAALPDRQGATRPPRSTAGCSTSSRRSTASRPSGP